MDKNIKSLLVFKNYIVNEVTYKANFEFSGRDSVTIDFDIENSTKIEGNNTFLLELVVTVFPNAEIKDYPFYIKVVMTGVFEIDLETTDNTKKSFIERNAIAILFPYIRALLSVYTSNANVGTLILPPINVVKYLEEKKKARK